MRNLLLLAILTSCGHSVVQRNSVISPASFAGEIYDKYGFSGSFLVYCAETDSTYYWNAEDTGKSYLPASTFKIPNTLFALESGIYQSASDTLQWDGVKRWVEAWNRDISLGDAYRLSCVWFYQETARRIGRPAMNRYIKLCDYGNMDTTGYLDSFWLNGNIRINHRQQIDFLKKIKNETLPFKPETYRIAKKIMIMDSTADYVLRAKTGWADQGDKAIGWYVGWLEKDGKTWYFSTRIYGGPNETVDGFGKARTETAREILGRLAGPLNN